MPKPQICHHCKNEVKLEDLRDVGTGNQKKLVCDTCYEKYYEGSDEDDSDEGFLGVGFAYCPGDPFW